MIPSQRSMVEKRIFTVTEVVYGANRCLETQFANIYVEGEISNLRIVASGHAYFTLKDEKACLPVAMWRSALARLRFRLAEGQRLHVFGRLGIYPDQGKFQMYAERAEPAGLGSLMLQLEQLKNKLAAEGLFAVARKRPLPAWPRTIGVVTSDSGAAIHDIIKVARRRCPSHILLAPALVQGVEAPASLLRALQHLQTWPTVDVIIIGRGGGAREDLWAFNDEALTRAIAACPVPVVTAIGHEIDTTLCDLAADLRAATPSHAAELVVPDAAQVISALREYNRRLKLACRRRLIDERTRFESTKHRLASRGSRLLTDRRRQFSILNALLSEHHPRRGLMRDRQKLTTLQTRLLACNPRVNVIAARNRWNRAREFLQRLGLQLTREARSQLATFAGALDALSPLAVLERGYAVVYNAKGQALLTSEQVVLGEEVAIRLHRGQLRAKVTDIAEESS